MHCALPAGPFRREAGTELRALLQLFAHLERSKSRPKRDRRAEFRSGKDCEPTPKLSRGVDLTQADSPFLVRLEFSAAHPYEAAQTSRFWRSRGISVSSGAKGSGSVRRVALGSSRNLVA